MPQFADVAKQTYTIKPNGAVEAALKNCMLCHAAPGPPKLNPYGTTVKAALKTANAGTNLTPAILHTLDTQDADGDGATNADEFAADTLPGDPASKPASNGTGSASTSPKQGHQGPTATVPPMSETRAKTIVDEVRGLVLPKHAQHPLVVHFPIALFFISVLFDLLGYWRKDTALMQAGFFNLIVASLGAFGALVTGLLAWIFLYDRSPLQGTLLNHLVLAIATSLLLWTLLALRLRQRGRMGPQVTRLYVVLAVFALAAMSITGHLGGVLSGVNQ